MEFDPDTLRARFAELGATRDAILAVSAPLREARDACVNEARATETTLNAGIAEVEDGLFAIDQERAMIARALGGRTGEQAA